MTVHDLDPTFDPELDLVLEREVPVAPALVWQAWTNPEHLKQWFTPAPWKTVEAEIDPRPGGVFSSTMESPEGDRYLNVGCVLEAVEDRRLVFTSTLAGGFRPVSPSNGAEDLPFSSIVVMEATDGGCRYTAIAKHADPAGRARHEEMGFQEGWGAALDQLVEFAQENLANV